MMHSPRFSRGLKLRSPCVDWQDQTKKVDCLINWLFVEYPREKVARSTDLENFREQSLHIQLAKKVNWLIDNQHGAFINCSVMNTINIGSFLACSVIISDSLKKRKVKLERKKSNLPPFWSDELILKVSTRSQFYSAWKTAIAGSEWNSFCEPEISAF